MGVSDEHREQIEIAKGWLKPDSIGHATALVAEYYDTPFAGAKFDKLAGSGERDELGPDDLGAVRALSMGIPRGFVAQIESTEFKKEMRVHLGLLSPELRLEDLSVKEYDDLLVKDAPAGRAWDFLVADLKQYRARGPYVTASKLLSAKRPLLIPLEDSFVRKSLHVSRKQAWEAIHRIVRDSEVSDRLSQVRDAVPNAGHVPLHRILDVVAWRKGRGY
jgi:Family of unknown function (DUF6308)